MWIPERPVRSLLGFWLELLGKRISLTTGVASYKNKANFEWLLAVFATMYKKPSERKSKTEESRVER